MQSVLFTSLSLIYQWKNLRLGFTPFLAFFSIWNRSLQSSSLSLVLEPKHMSILMKQKGIPPALVSGCDDLQYNRRSNWCKDWVQWGKQNLVWESYEAFGRTQVFILIWENIAAETDLISKVFIIQMTMTTLGYFKNMSFRIFPGFQNQGRLMFVVLFCLNILYE